MDSIYHQPVRMIPPYRVISRVQILSETQDYNIQLMNVPSMWKQTMGEGVRVAVLDTGLPKHVDLAPKGGKSFIEGYLEDQQGHGTHVAGILAALANNGMGVAGVAPNCELWCGAVLGADGSGTFEGIVNGIRWAVDEIGAKVINMSLGVPTGTPRLTELEKACDYAKSQGVTVVCAAGNDANFVGQPACYDSVLAISAVDSKKEFAGFSNWGKQVDFAAGGVNVYSTYLNNGYAKLSGTSMSSPAVAGIVTLILADEYKDNEKWLTPDEVTEKLKKIAFDCGPQGFDEMYGNGIPMFKNGDSAEPVPEPEPPKKKEPKFCDLSLLFPSAKAFVDAAIQGKDGAEVSSADTDEMVKRGLKGLQDFLQRVEEVRTRQG